MTKYDYDCVYQLWSNTTGMGMRSVDDSKEGIAKYLARNPDTCFVAESDDIIIGVILCGHDGRRGYIYHTCVSEAYRNQGIGTALVDNATKALIEQGINKVALVAFQDNTLGNSFWDLQGFEDRDDLVYRNKSLNIRNL